MNRRIYIIIASILMLLVGLLRGTGGILLLLNGNNLEVEPSIVASDLTARICGTGLILLFVIFAVSSFRLLKNKSLSGWKLGWIGIFAFILGGLLNGYLLFGTPFVQDQVINIGASILIGGSLLIGKKSLK